MLDFLGTSQQSDDFWRLLNELYTKTPIAVCSWTYFYTLSGDLKIDVCACKSWESWLIISWIRWQFLRQKYGH